MASKRCKKAKLLAHRAQHRSFTTERLKTTTKESRESELPPPKTADSSNSHPLKPEREG